MKNLLNKKKTEKEIRARTYELTGTLERSRAHEEGHEGEDRTFELSFSSSDALPDFQFGRLVLGHEPGEVDLSFLSGGNAPLLVEHARCDQVGVIENAWLEEGKGRARVRLGRSARAEEIYADINDGIRGNTSVYFEINKVKFIETVDDVDTYRATAWKPYEVSIVSVPHDASTGVGRSAPDETDEPITEKTEETEQPEPAAAPNETPPAPDSSTNQESNTMEQPENTPAPDRERSAPEKPEISVQHVREEAMAAERKRSGEIIALGAQCDQQKEAQKYVNEGKSVEEFRAHCIDTFTNGTQPHYTGADMSENDKKEVQTYSIARAYQKVLNGERLDGIEGEMHEEGLKDIRSRGGESSASIVIPNQVMYHKRQPTRQRDVTFSTESTDLVGTQVSSTWIELLVNQQKLRMLGARYLTGLRSNLQFPRLSGGGTATFKASGSTLDESTPTFDNVSLSAKRIGHFVDHQKQLVVQANPDVEAIILEDLLGALDRGIENAAINGDGTGENPTGILNASGTGAVEAGDPDGGAPSWSLVVELMKTLKAANVPGGNFAYLTNSACEAKLKTTEKASSTARFLIDDNDRINGLPYECTEFVPSNGTKGAGTNLSSLICARWDQLFIGMWGGIELIVDRASQAADGLVRSVVETYADVALRHESAFAIADDITTT